jgi:glycosyltransferase involved in cell wall biosynthesis
MKKEIKKGVSVILCCYNSSSRISKTLQALARQEFIFPVSWEIILVDNASTDHTSTIAQSTWKSLNTTTGIRIIYEPLQGLAFARKAGIREASYSYLVFCDDDNWLTPGYIQRVYDILESSPDIAACGGLGIPVFETSKPSWFDEYKEAFALGSQDGNSENGRILNLYGAGLGVNRKMIEKLEMTEFRPFMTGRVGNKLCSSEDTELTYALTLMGYKLHYSPELQFYHFLPKERLTVDYLKKLFIAFGNDGPVRNLYYSMITRRFLHRRIRNWSFHLLLSIARLIKYGIIPPKKHGRSIYYNWNITYIRELLSLRSSYPRLKQRIEKIKGIAAEIPNQ